MLPFSLSGISVFRQSLAAKSRSGLEEEGLPLKIPHKIRLQDMGIYGVIQLMKYGSNQRLTGGNISPSTTYFYIVMFVYVYKRNRTLCPDLPLLGLQF